MTVDTYSHLVVLKIGSLDRIVSLTVVEFFQLNYFLC